MKLISLIFWFLTFTPSERVAFAAAFLVLVGVTGEYVIELKAIEKKEEWKKWIKRLSMALLLLGLTGDVLGIVMGQAEMAELTQETGDAATLAKTASGDAKNAISDSLTAQTKADAAGIAASKAQTKEEAVDREADAQKTRLSENEKHLDALEKRGKQLEDAVAPRPEIDIRFGGGHSNIDSLIPFAKKINVLLEYLPTTEGDAAQLRQVFKASGWNIVHEDGYSPYVFDEDVEIWRPSEPYDDPEIILGINASVALCKFLESAGWRVDTRGASDSDAALRVPHNALRVTIGRKSQRYFEPEDVKKLHDWMDAEDEKLKKVTGVSPNCR